ncbi:hypothetical protein [Microvirga brassicacearum]|uniref:hypothetical protein n=1 Tax=Microvirga brassicacearum TaxID=2580413 RepID=UPI001FCECF0C|nr:hypothetical protein [Microvirga brassicacearum]
MTKGGKTVTAVSMVAAVVEMDGETGTMAAIGADTIIAAIEVRGMADDAGGKTADTVNKMCRETVGALMKETEKGETTVDELGSAAAR